MRYLRMLTNAVAGGVLGAAYFVVLVLQLNPQIPTVSLTTLHWFLAMAAFYGLYLTVTIYLLILAREVLASRSLSPAWLSVRLMAWVGTACAGATAAITWANLESFHELLGDAAADHMRRGATATTAFATVLFAVAVLRYSFGRRGSRPAAVLLLVSLTLSVAVPLWARGPGEFRVPAAAPTAPPWVRAGAAALIPPPVGSLPKPIGRPPRVRVIVLDGASLGFVRLRVAAGQLPSFGRMLERGAVVDLATLEPTQADPIWAAAATGKYAAKNGVRSNATYRARPSDTDVVDLLPDHCFAYALVSQRFVAEEHRTSASLAARPMWSILDDYAIVSGVANWPLTFPAHASRGYVISDRFDEATSSPLRLADAQAGDPTTASDIAREVFDEWQSRAWYDLLPSLTPTEPKPDGLDGVRWDRAYSAAAVELDREFAPKLTTIRYEGLDEFGHLYLRDAQPELFGESNPGEPRRSVLDRYYAFIDGQIGLAASALDPGDLLLVVSGFGMEQESLEKRMLNSAFGWLLATPAWSGTHERAPDGFMLAYGTNVVHAELPRGSVVDLAPTVLYYLGLPVGRDMDGAARTDLFARAYTLDHPVASIGTYEKVAAGGSER